MRKKIAVVCFLLVGLCAASVEAKGGGHGRGGGSRGFSSGGSFGRSSFGRSSFGRNSFGGSSLGRSSLGWSSSKPKTLHFLGIPQIGKSEIHRDNNGRVERSESAKRAFIRIHPCPGTGQTHGPCPGYVVDHIRALAIGGPDAPSNMQWQTTAAAKAKDKTERK